MVPGAQPGTDNIKVYMQQLNESGKSYEADNLPPLDNVQERSDITNDYYELCRGKRLVKVAICVVLWTIT